ncbi:GTP-binding protein [Acinetobacter sp. SFB]|uniref:GTP-binding protein n=1 Tax=Acinetobacter sp. SFB TaxID=1805634 RepID=UPI0007D7FDAC|nr:ATP/GTP-binding protein [Acinetobacter sp. SFB]OAL79810.1 GTP-binding protein [Acinetobacter sp. SFB]
MILQHYKIVFAGSMGAGKSAAINTISDISVLSTEAVNTDTTSHQKVLTTVGIDYGEITLEEDIKVGLYGTPGQERFDFIWSAICKGALGTIILIDHSAEHPIQQLNEYFSTFKEMNDNIVIGITHLDQKTKNTTLIYREWAELQSKTYPVFFIDARIKNDVLLLVETLIANAEIQIAH